MTQHNTNQDHVIDRRHASIPIGVLIVSIILDVSNISLNSSLAYIIWKISKLNTISYWFMFSLSLSDTAIGVAGLVYHSLVASTLSGSATGNFKVEYAVITYSSFAGCSARFIFLIAIDRFVHMKYLTRYHSLMTKQRALLLVGMNLVLVSTEMLTMAFPAISIFYYPTITFLHTAGAIVSVMLYVWAFMSVKSRVDNSHLDQSNVRRIDRHFAKGVLIIIISLIGCYTPPLAVVFCKYYLRMDIKHSVMAWVRILIYLHSTLNAIILTVFNREIKNFLKRTLCS